MASVSGLPFSHNTKIPMSGTSALMLENPLDLILPGVSTDQCRRRRLDLPQELFRVGIVFKLKKYRRWDGSAKPGGRSNPNATGDYNLLDAKRGPNPPCLNF